MAITIISSIEKVANGTIIVPSGCSLIAAFVDGSVIPPKIDGVDMGTIASVPATSIIPAISAHIYQTPAIATLPFTMSGTSVQFVYLSGADTNRPGPIFGYSSGGVFNGNIVTSATDLVIGILHGSIGPTAMKGDTVEMTYLKNSTLLKIGYVFSAVTLLACLAQDTGVSGGYNIDNGTLHHDAVLVSAGHYTYDAVWVPGHFEYGHRWMEAHWGWVWNNDLHQQVWTWIEGSEYDYETWLDGYYYYPAVWHDAVWIPAYDEDLGDTWVEIGPSQISCVFCSIQTTPSGEVVSSPIIFQ